MKKTFITLLTFIILVSSCKKETIVTPVVEKPKLLQSAVTTSDGKVIEQYTYEYDAQQRIFKETEAQSASVCDWTHSTNKMTLKCPGFSVDWDYTIINGLVTQRIDKITNERQEYEYDTQQHYTKTVRYDKDGKVVRTTNFIYNNEGNKTDIIVSGGTNTKYEYSKTVLATTNISTGYPMFGIDTKNAVMRETSKDIKGTTLSDTIYAYETDEKGYIIKKTATDVLKPNQQAIVTVYSYK